MHWKRRFVLRVQSYWFDFKYGLRNLPGKIKRIVWNKYILLWWYRLWIRKDEFHKSLDSDPLAMMEMTPDERRKYDLDRIRRRQIAHHRDMEREDAGIV